MASAAGAKKQVKGLVKSNKLTAKYYRRGQRLPKIKFEIVSGCIFYLKIEIRESNIMFRLRSVRDKNFLASKRIMRRDIKLIELNDLLNAKSEKDFLNKSIILFKALEIYFNQQIDSNSELMKFFISGSYKEFINNFCLEMSNVTSLPEPKEAISTVKSSRKSNKRARDSSASASASATAVAKAKGKKKKQKRMASPVSKVLTAVISDKGSICLQLGEARVASLRLYKRKLPSTNNSLYLRIRRLGAPLPIDVQLTLHDFMYSAEELAINPWRSDAQLVNFLIRIVNEIGFLATSKFTDSEANNLMNEISIRICKYGKSIMLQSKKPKLAAVVAEPVVAASLEDSASDSDSDSSYDSDVSVRLTEEPMRFARIIDPCPNEDHSPEEAIKNMYNADRFWDRLDKPDAMGVGGAVPTLD